MRQTARSTSEPRRAARRNHAKGEAVLAGDAVLQQLELTLDHGDPLHGARGIFNGILIGAALWLAATVAFLIATF